MDTYEEIITRIKNDLAELTKINNQLKVENEMLRKKLDIPKQVNTAVLSLEDAFEHFEVSNDTGNMKMRTYTTLSRAGYRGISITQFERMNVYELFELRNMGVNSLAILIIVLEHFGVSIEIPAAINKLKKVVAEYRDRITFND